MYRTTRWWRIRRWLRGPGRFYFSLLFTVVVVAYVVVPWVVQIVATVGDYNPVYYEPKDEQREDYLSRSPGTAGRFFGWESAVKFLLLVLVGLVWLVAVPAAPWRGRGASRR